MSLRSFEDQFTIFVGDTEIEVEKSGLECAIVVWERSAQDSALEMNVLGVIDEIRAR
jgi:hypothetical protein